MSIAAPANSEAAAHAQPEINYSFLATIAATRLNTSQVDTLISVFDRSGCAYPCATLCTQQGLHRRALIRESSEFLGTGTCQDVLLQPGSLPSVIRIRGSIPYRRTFYSRGVRILQCVVTATWRVLINRRCCRFFHRLQLGQKRRGVKWCTAKRAEPLTVNLATRAT